MTRGGARRVVGYNEYDSVDPHRIFGDPASWILNNVQSKLVWYKNPDTGEIEPDLAERYEAPDAATYTFRLRQGVRWHNRPPANGREFTADDVRWHLERQQAQKLADGSESPMRHASFYKSISRVEAPDRYTVRLTLAAPNGVFLDQIAAHYSTIPNREALEKHEADHRTLTEEAVIGTGPFMLAQWRAGKDVLLKRNPDYFRKDAPVMDGQILSTLFSDPNAQRAAFEQKQLDAWSAPDQTTTKAVLDANRGGMYEVTSGTSNTVFLHLNIQQQLREPRLVRALHIAVDRRLLIQSFHQGLGQVSGPVTWIQEGFAIPPDELIKLPGYRTDRDAERRDARALWQAGGGPALGEVDIRVPSLWLARWPDSLQVLPKMFNDALGVTQFKSTRTDYGEEIIPNLGNGRFPNWFGWTNAVKSADPRTTLYAAFHSRGSENFEKVNDARLDKLLEEALALADYRQAVAKVREIQTILLDNGMFGNINLYNYIDRSARWNYYRGNLKQEPSGTTAGVGYNLSADHLGALTYWINTKDPTYQGRPPAAV